MPNYCSQHHCHVYHTGTYLSYGSSYVQVLSIILHWTTYQDFFFLVVWTLEKVSIRLSTIDDILGLPFFHFSGKWAVLPLLFASPSPVYFIDPCSKDDTSHPKSSYLVSCLWCIDYVWYTLCIDNIDCGIRRKSWLFNYYWSCITTQRQWY